MGRGGRFSSIERASDDGASHDGALFGHRGSDLDDAGSNLPRKRMVRKGHS